MCFNERVYSALILARHVSDLIGPSSGAFLQAVYVDLVCSNTRTTRHVKLDVSSSTRITTYEICQYSLYKTLLMMDQ